MATLITDCLLERDIIAQRRAWDVDHKDEVWDGVYFIPPSPDNEHQALAGRISYVLMECFEWHGLAKVRLGVNVSDRRRRWKRNYRVPDLVVFLEDTKAENLDTHWFGGPDFGVEIVIPGDRTREKIAFYEKVGMRELLIVDRKPWALELHRHDRQRLTLVGRTTLDESLVLEPSILPLAIELVAGEKRPRIRIRHRTSDKAWVI
jgi:Uma2 family endonuclease